jgi:hypothetical protein
MSKCPPRFVCGFRSELPRWIPYGDRSSRRCPCSGKVCAAVRSDDNEVPETTITSHKWSRLLILCGSNFTQFSFLARSWIWGYTIVGVRGGSYGFTPRLRWACISRVSIVKVALLAHGGAAHMTLVWFSDGVSPCITSLFCAIFVLYWFSPDSR